MIFISFPLTGGSTYPLSSQAKPFEGNSSPIGGLRIISSPSSFIKLSVNGLKSSLPDKATAITISGEDTNA